MSKSYHGQFQENQRNKNQNGLFSNSKATAGGKLPAQRPTAVVKQPLRSDTFTLPTNKRDETYVKVPNVNQAQNGSRRQAATKPAVINSPPSAEQKRTETMRKNVGAQPMIKRSSNSTIDRQNLQRKPVRFTNDYNNTYYSSSSSPPVYYQKTAPLADPLPREAALDKSQHMRIANDEYIIHRRKNSPAYAYTDYHTVSDIPTISYVTSLPPITQPTNQTTPTVIIHSKETLHSDPPTIIPTLSTVPSYHSSAPVMILPSSAAPSYPPTSTMILPPSTIPSYPPTSTMILPTTTAPTQPPVHTFLLSPPSVPTYMSQPLFYPIPYPKPNHPSSAPPPPPPQQTIISQSSSSSTSAPVSVKTENKSEENHPTIIVRPNTTNNNRKNMTIQVKMIDEDSPLDKTRSQRVVQVVHEPDDLYYIESEPKRIIYEQPKRRTAIIQKSPPTTEYVYVDESPSPLVRHRPYRSEVIYIDNDQPLEYEEEIVYVDHNGNEIEYIYDDEPIYHRRNYKKSLQPSTTNIVYE